MANYYARGWLKYADFSSRSSRPEYWIFAWVNFLISNALLAIDMLTGLGIGGTPIGPLYIAYALATIIPSLAIVVRRLRDAGYPPTYFFFAFVPFAGGIIMLVLLCKKSAASDALTSDFAQGDTDLLDSFELGETEEKTRSMTRHKEVINQIVLIILIYFIFNSVKWIVLTSSLVDNGLGDDFEVHSYISRLTYGSMILALPFLSTNKTVRAVALTLAIVFLFIDNAVRGLLTLF